jgi:hypothetical protein
LQIQRNHDGLKSLSFFVFSPAPSITVAVF